MLNILGFTAKYSNTTIGLIISIILIAGFIIYRVNKLLTRIETIETEFKLLEKRTKKMLQIMGQCPSIPRENALWVQDDKRNGGTPPEKSQCKYPYKGSDNNCVENG